MIENWEKHLDETRPKSKIFTERFNCPDRYSSAAELKDCWTAAECCSYCGGLNPDVLIERLKAGTCTITPTDKNYKAYVCNNGGESFKQQYRIDELKGDAREDPRNWVWTVRDTSQAKFYYQHLSKEQKAAFIEIFNAKKMQLDAPGYFYVAPFFCTTVTTDGSV
jgi:hypothetical protein